MDLEALVRDTRYAGRRLARDWRFTAAAVLILGLAIGANTAMFSVINAVLFRQEVLPDGDRLVNIYQNDRAGNPLVVTSSATYLEIARNTDTFTGVLASSIPNPARYAWNNVIRSGVVEFATANYLDVLGLQPSLGRWFETSETQPGAAMVAVIGEQTWSRTFRRDPSIIGRPLRINGIQVTIVGVGPAGHRGTVDMGLGTDFWLPLPALPVLMPNPATNNGSTIYAPLLVKARLRDGVTPQQAKAAMDVLAPQLVAAFPEDYRREGEGAIGPGLSVIPATDVRIHPQADLALKALAAIVLVVVGLVLAIACSNLATLLLVRGSARAKEISVRLAVGAKRHHLVRHLLTESLLLALAGGIAGCLAAGATMRVLERIELPVTVDLTLDYRVLGFALLLSVVTGVAFGLAPAIKATRVDLLPSLRDDAGQAIEYRRLTFKNVLIGVQVMLSVVLLGGTSIFLQQAAAARAHRVGYAVDGVAILQTDVRFSTDPTARPDATLAELQRRIAAVPGVRAVTLLPGLPLASTGVGVVVEGNADASASVPATMIEAGTGFFDTLRIPLLYGRVFDERDSAATPRVAVITDTMAQRYFGGANAVGRRFRTANNPDTWMEVIGVVRDTGTGRFEDDVIDPVGPLFYRAYTQAALPSTTVVARTSGAASTLVGTMQRELRSVDITLPVLTAQTMTQRLESSQAAPRVVATALAGLAGLGLLLASIGLYSVVAFAVASRSREIGIRMALGAGSREVVWSIARGVTGVVGGAIGAGLAVSILLMLLLRSVSGGGDIGVGSIAVFRPDIDPLALLTIAAVTAMVGTAAALIPGRRAATMDPVVALRHE